MSGPLGFLRILDCTRGIAGARAAGMLADYGAEVIRVEPPGGDPWAEAEAVAYSVFNRGKQSVVLDLAEAADRESLLRLVETADVFIQSWRPGVAKRLGLDAVAVAKRNPSCVYGTISGFGLEGSDSELAGYEALAHALVGTMNEQAGHRAGPIFQALPFASIGAANLLVIGLLAAVYRRTEDGRGRHVETSLLDGVLAYLGLMWGDSDVRVETEILPGAGRRSAVGMTRRLITRTYVCSDGEYVGVHSGAVGAFSRLMKVLGLEEHFPPSPDGLDMSVPVTSEQADILWNRVPEIMATRSRSEWVKVLLDADVCVMPHLSPTDVFDEAQPQHNEMIVELDDPVLGRVQQVAPPVKLHGSPTSKPTPAPRLGEHTERVLANLGRDPRRLSEPRADTEDDTPLLDGVKILDIGAYYAGPYSSRLLADLGADVIKLETIAGDALRTQVDAFQSCQAGKRGISLNLKEPEGRSMGAALASWADILHHNMRPGAAERLGLGYQQALEVNPNLIYLHAPGWGTSGPDAHRQSFAPLMSGLVGVGYEAAGQFNPPMFSVGNEDPGNGMVGSIGILIALLHRQRTGEGQFIENPQLNAAMMHMGHIVRRSDGKVLGAGRLDPLQVGFSALERLYETSDGWVCVVALRDREVEALASALGQDFLADERFATRAARTEHDYELGVLIGKLMEERSTADWLDALASAGVPAVDPLPNTERAFLRSPEHIQSGRVGECPHPVEGHVRGIASLVRVSDARPPVFQLAPKLGEHSVAILRSLGYTPSSIEDLVSSGVARTEPLAGGRG